MADDRKKPSAPDGGADKDITRSEKNPDTGEPSASYGEEGPTETTSPAEKQPS